MFGDPCRGTNKYLEVEYSCVPTRKFHNIDSQFAVATLWDFVYLSLNIIRLLLRIIIRLFVIK